MNLFLEIPFHQSAGDIYEVQIMWVPCLAWGGKDHCGPRSYARSSHL